MKLAVSECLKARREENKMALDDNLNVDISKYCHRKVYREKGSKTNIVQLGDFLPDDANSNRKAGVEVWYPLTDTCGFIENRDFVNYEKCSAVEIEKARRLEASQKQSE